MRLAPSSRVLRVGLAGVLLGSGLVAGGAQAAPRFAATIRYTEYGMPHITAKDWGGVGFGYGYAAAKDNICILADSYTTVDAQRSRYFGPDAGYVFSGNGYSVNNLNSDFFFQQIMDDKRIEKMLTLRPPHGPRPEIKLGVAGYVAGYNRYLKDIRGAAGVTDPACKGKPWVRPISEMTAYRRFYQLALLASSGVAIDGIASAQPPHPSLPLPVAPDPDAAAASLARGFETLAIGSNAVAVGSQGTVNRRGLLLGNPHFPWRGSERFWQAHITIPGKVDVSGGSLLGVPLVLIGHTASVAWSHTVSTAFRFTPFQLTLVPGVPTAYLVDGMPERMTTRDVTVDVLQEDGSLAKQSRTLYSTRYGPVLTSLIGLPIFPWTPTVAWALGDANAGNFRYMNHFFEVNQAASVRDVLAILKRNQGIPWVNTIAADNNGEALYADISVTPNVSDEKAADCNTAVGTATFRLLRLPVLDGSRADCMWDNDPDALQPGTFGPGHMPSLIRRDYVTNSNDSYWLSNPRQPLTGFAQIIGNEETVRTLRTRSGLVMVEERLAGVGAKHKGFTRQDLQDLVFNNRQYAGELTRDALVELCNSMPGGWALSSKGPVDVSEACPVLEGWDGRDDPNSRGALLFRRFWVNVIGALPSQASAANQFLPLSPWKVAFDPDDPVHTPNTLDTSNPLVVKALGDAVNDLAGAGIPLGAPLKDFQYAVRNGAKIPIHGGPGTLGMFNAVNVTWDATRGYIDPPHGTSFVQVVSFTGSRCPDTRTILTYSQSANPTSPHYADQTVLFGQKKWVPGRFCEAQIRTSPVLRTVRLSQ